MRDPLGRRCWVVPDGYLPRGKSDGLCSHEAVCLLNTGESDAHLALTVYLEDADPMTFTASVPSRRTRHLRLDQFRDPGGRSIPRETAFALTIRSDVPVVVQHSRMDVRSPRMALMTTMAFPADSWSGYQAGIWPFAAVKAMLRPDPWRRSLRKQR